MKLHDCKPIEIKIQREDRLKAITELAIAIKTVAQALSEVPQVNITGCQFNPGKGTGINVSPWED